jgi:DMSO/TMAO reductase YedYZ molybdopterin-dependent catalytic subunit
VDDPDELFVQSLQDAVLGQTTLNNSQASDPRSLLALQVNGADLSLDHGFPARIIVPALPGVHNTKWVQRLEFRGA